MDSPLNHAVTWAGMTGSPCAWHRQSDVVGGPGRSAPLTARDRRHFFNHARGTRRYAPGLKRLPRKEARALVKQQQDDERMERLREVDECSAHWWAKPKKPLQ